MYESQAETLEEAVREDLGCWIPCLIHPKPAALLSDTEAYIIIDVPGCDLPVTAIESRFRVIDLGEEAEEGDLSGKFRKGLVRVAILYPDPAKEEGRELCQVWDCQDPIRFTYPEEKLIFGNFEDLKWKRIKERRRKIEGEGKIVVTQQLPPPPDAGWDFARGCWLSIE